MEIDYLLNTLHGNELNSNINPVSSKYYTVDELSTQCSSKNQLTILHLNTQSLPSKFDRIKLLLHSLQQNNIHIDILLLCKTFLNERNHSLYELPGYSFIET